MKLSIRRLALLIYYQIESSSTKMIFEQTANILKNDSTIMMWLFTST